MKLKQFLRRFGIDVQRYRPDSSPEAQLSRILRYTVPDLVLDVGANAGQYGESLRRCGYRGRIVSFEPLSQAYALLSRASAGDPLWAVGPRVALGAEEADLVMNVSANMLSHSLLPMLSAHLDAAPDSGYVGTERVMVRRLDDAAAPYLQDAARIFLKIDTQGYEDRVLTGAHETLDRVIALQLELSLVPLYGEQSLFLEITDQLRSLGYDLFAIVPGFVDPRTGQTLQIDGVFTRYEGSNTGSGRGSPPRGCA